LWDNASFAQSWHFAIAGLSCVSLIFLSLIEGFSMSQFRLARLCVMLAAVGLAPALMNNAFAQQKDKQPAAAAPAAEQKGPSVRPELLKLVDPNQIKPLLDAKNFTEVQTRISQAEALPNLTPYETYVINRMKLSLGSTAGNDAMAMPALEAVINSGFLTDADKDNFIVALGNMYYNAKNYPKAIEWYKRYEKESATPDKVHGALIRAYYLSGDYATAKTALLPVLSDKSGAAPAQEDLRLLASSANKVKDDATYLAALDKMIAYYPSDDFWLDAINRGIQRRPGFDGNENLVGIYRLMGVAVQQMSAEDYVNYGELALQAGFPTEAKKAIDKGFAAGVLGTGANAAKHRQLRDKATRDAANDAKGIASGEASAAKSKNGAGLVNIGWAYVTMGEYDKGIGFIQQGIAKGGLKHNGDEARLRLGVAYYQAGRKDEAVKAFESVKAGGGLSDLAKYWIILAKQPAQVPTAPVSPAPAPAK
jgi:tetratricopeptide (TPR) repeat protein